MKGESMKRERSSRSNVYSTKEGSISRGGWRGRRLRGCPGGFAGLKAEIIFGKDEKEPVLKGRENRRKTPSGPPRPDFEAGNYAGALENFRTRTSGKK